MCGEVDLANALGKATARRGAALVAVDHDDLLRSDLTREGMGDMPFHSPAAAPTGATHHQKYAGATEPRLQLRETKRSHLLHSCYSDQREQRRARGFRPRAAYKWIDFGGPSPHLPQRSRTKSLLQIGSPFDQRVDQLVPRDVQDVRHFFDLRSRIGDLAGPSPVPEPREVGVRAVLPLLRVAGEILAHGEVDVRVVDRVGAVSQVRVDGIAWCDPAFCLRLEGEVEVVEVRAKEVVVAVDADRSLTSLELCNELVHLGTEIRPLDDNLRLGRPVASREPPLPGAS